MTSTAQLIADLRDLDKLTEPTEEQRIARRDLIQEIERRHPAAATAVARAFLNATIHEERTGERVHVDYVTTLVSAIEPVS